MFLLGTFYFFASFLIVTCISVIFSKNPVNSVLFLVLAFLNSTFLFILIGAVFVGIILAIVYIGAVAILFLFVVMMLDIQITTLMFNIKRYVPLALLFAGVILAEIIYLTVFKSSKSNLSEIFRSSNNTEEIGLMDPFVKFTFRDITEKTATIDEGGKLVSWNEEVTFSVADIDDFENEDILVKIIDKDVISNDTVGSRSFKVGELLQKEGQQVYDLYSCDEVAARLTLWCYMK